MFYIVKYPGSDEMGGLWEVDEFASTVPDTVWATYLSRGFQVNGCFGRKDYADCYADYYNGKISMKELMLLLEAKSESESDDSV